MGQPLWVWGAGAVALIGGYIYLRNKGAAAGTSSTAGQPAAAVSSSPTGMSWDQFLLFLHDQQSSTSTASTATTSGPAPKPAVPAAKPAQKMYWSGALGKWMTGAQWHQWHVQHLAHQKKAG